MMGVDAGDAGESTGPGVGAGAGFGSADKGGLPDLRSSLCSGDKIPMGKKQYTIIGEGKMGLVICVTNGPTKEALCLKSGRVNATRGGGAAKVKSSTDTVDDISLHEVDMCRLLYNLLHTTGMCPHVCRIAGIGWMDGTRRFTASGIAPNMGRVMVMEALQGIRVNIHGTTKMVYDLQAYVKEAATIASEAERFDTVLKTALFQAVFTMYVLDTALEGCFRHNDFHAGNVGVEVREGEGASAVCRQYAVIQPRSDGRSVSTTFTITGTVNSNVLDFGYAALLYPLAAEKDTASLRDHTAASAHGMSSERKCAYYDLMLLLCSVRSLCGKALQTETECVPVPPRTKAAMLEFLTFFESRLGCPETVKDGTMDLHDCSRLSLKGQEIAAMSGGNFLSATKTGSRVWKRLLTPAEFLCSSYFSCFDAAQQPFCGRPAGSSSSVLYPGHCRRSVDGKVFGLVDLIDTKALVAEIQADTDRFFRDRVVKTNKSGGRAGPGGPVGLQDCRKQVLELRSMTETTISSLHSRVYVDFVAMVAQKINARILMLAMLLGDKVLQPSFSVGDEDPCTGDTENDGVSDLELESLDPPGSVAFVSTVVGGVPWVLDDSDMDKLGLVQTVDGGPYSWQ
jgi:hypothetical protein